MSDDERRAFLEDRQKGLGGTDMVMLFGLDSYRGRDALDLYYDKTRPIGGVDAADNIHLLRGRVTEPTAAALYWGHTEREGRKAPAVFTHPDYPAFRCHLDYEIFADPKREPEWTRGTGVLDIKAPIKEVFARVFNEGARESEIMQVQTYIAVTRREWGSLGFCNLEHSDGPILSVDIQADPAVSKHILETGQRFWDEHVLKGVPPDPADWKLDHEGPALVESRGGDLVLIDDTDPRWDEVCELGRVLLDAQAMKKQGTTLYDAGKASLQEWMEANLDSDKLELPGLGKFTIVRAKGRVSLREDTLRAATPVDRDKLLAWLSQNGISISSEEFDWLLLDFAKLEKQGAGYSFLKPTDKRRDQ